MVSEDKVNVLVVDDQPANLVAMEACLEDLPGIRLVMAGSGSEAWRHLLKDEFALIIMDIAMPISSGFDIIKLMQGLERTRHTPVIFVTATYMGDLGVIQEAYNLGAVDLLFKPAPPLVLRAKVKVFADLHREKRRLQRELERRGGGGEETADRPRTGFS